MADKSAIEWTDATWNPIVGCSIVSKGCTNCYAMKVAGARTSHTAKYQGLTERSKAGPVWTGEVRFWERALLDPLKWKEPRRVFVNSMGDLFHESIPDEWIDRVFAVMALAPQHTFQILTKRPERMRAYFAERWQGTSAMTVAGIVVPSGSETGRRSQIEDAVDQLLLNDKVLGKRFADTENDDHWTAAGGLRCQQFGWPLPNVWLGVSTEDQATANERIPLLLDTPAAVRFISAEPLLEHVDLHALNLATRTPSNALSGVKCLPDDSSAGFHNEPTAKLDWVIVGGESGPGARPMHPAWAHLLRDQCQSAGVPFFFKQWGEWAPHKAIAGGDLGGDVRAGRVRIVHPTGQSDVEVSIATGGFSTIPGSRYMAKVGKKNSGARLGGRDWREFPEAKEVTFA